MSRWLGWREEGGGVQAVISGMRRDSRKEARALGGRRQLRIVQGIAQRLLKGDQIVETIQERSPVYIPYGTFENVLPKFHPGTCWNLPAYAGKSYP
jgi:hypothetical protein